MKFKINNTEKEEVVKKIKRALEKRPEVSFAYLHGSFTKSESFSDIDIALYLDTLPPSPLEYELAMEVHLMDLISKYPVDVRILNRAPLSFRYNVIHEGKLLVVRDDDQRADFQETTVTRYFDFAPHRDAYLRETLGLDI